MTEFPDTHGGQVAGIAGEVTGLTAAAEEVVAARPELVWDLVADITRVGGWSPECIRAARRDGLQANMSATLRAMKAAAESSRHTGGPE